MVNDWYCWMLLFGCMHRSSVCTKSSSISSVHSVYALSVRWHHHMTIIHYHTSSYMTIIHTCLPHDHHVLCQSLMHQKSPGDFVELVLMAAISCSACWGFLVEVGTQLVCPNVHMSLSQEVMLEHHMRVACVATFNFASFQALATSNMETRQQVQGQVPADKWRSVVVSLYMLPG